MDDWDKVLNKALIVHEGVPIIVIGQLTRPIGFF